MVDQRKAQHPLLNHLHGLASERRRRERTRTLFRGLWLTACVWCVGLGGFVAQLWPLRTDLLWLLSGLILAGTLLPLIRGAMRPQDVARRLDSRFALDEQLATAVEVLERQEQPNVVSTHLLEASQRQVRGIRQHVRRNQAEPRSDALLLMAFSLILAGLLLMANIGHLTELLTNAGPPPELTRPDEQQSPNPPNNGQQPATAGQPGSEGQPQPGQQGDPQVLGPIADALRNQGATRPAAEALDRGDIGAAAESLRDLADQAEQLSPESRRDLSRELDEAADQIQQQNPDLADQLRQSAEQIRQGGDQAQDGLEALADALEQSQAPQPPSAGTQDGQTGQEGEQGQGQSEQPSDPQSGNQQGGGSNPSGGDQSGETQQRDLPSDRLGVEGQPLELEADGDGQNGANDNKPPTSTGGSNGGFTEGGRVSSERVEAGSDPLRVPADERDVVQDYFSQEP